MITEHPQFTPGPLQLRASGTPSANNRFHLYLADPEGRKIAALWGGNDEKLANGYLWAAAPRLYELLDRGSRYMNAAERIAWRAEAMAAIAEAGPPTGERA